MAEEPDSFRAGDTTPKTTPPVVPAPSRPHGKTAATVPDIPMPLDPNMHMAQDQNNDDDDTFTDVDKYFAEHGYGDEFGGPKSQEPNQGDRDLAGTAEKSNCNGVVWRSVLKRRLQLPPSPSLR